MSASRPVRRGRPRRRPGRDDGADAVAAAGLPTTGPKAIVVVRDDGGAAARPGLGAGDGHRGRAGRDRLARRAQRAAALDRARARPGRAGPVPGGQARHRPADRERLLLRLRRGQAVPPGRPRQAREADAGDRQVGPAVPPAPLRLPGRGQGGAGRRAVQARAGRHQGRRRRDRGDGGRRRRADHLRQPRPEDRRARVGRPVPRPAPAVHQADRRVQADAHRRRVLARVGEEPAAAAGVRHRVADPGRAQGVPAAARGGRPARPPQARRRPGPVLLPRRDRLRARRLPPQGRHHPARAGELLAAAARGGRVLVRQHPAHHQGSALRDLGAPAVLRGHHVPADADGGRGVLPQADELPVPQPDLRARAGGRTGSCRCGCSSSARSTGTRSPAWCTA